MEQSLLMLACQDFLTKYDSGYLTSDEFINRVALAMLNEPTTQNANWLADMLIKALTPAENAPVAAQG